MRLILLLFCSFLSLCVLAQSSKDSLKQEKEMIIFSPNHKASKDSTKIKILRDTKNENKENSVSELFIIGKSTYKKGDHKPMGRYAPFKGHWTGFQYGFVNYAHLPDAWNDLDLDWSHSFSMQFNLCKYCINLTPHNNFGLVTGLGLEYQRLRFNNNDVSIAKISGKLVIINPKEEYSNIASIKRSTFKNLYLTIPLLAEIQFPARNTHRMYIAGGIMGGVRMHSKTKIVYHDDKDDKYKKKGKGNFNMVPFKADAVVRMGYRQVNVWGSYTLTNMFKSSDTPNLHLYTIGLGITI
ncbi:MAG: outer membrane beta-barrel protein [Odoribacter sp.]